MINNNNSDIFVQISIFLNKIIGFTVVLPHMKQE